MFAIIKKSFNYVTSAMLSGVSTAFKHARSSARDKYDKYRNKKYLNKRNLNAAGCSGDDPSKNNNNNSLPKDRLSFQNRLINFLKLLLAEVNRLRRIRQGLFAGVIGQSTGMDRIIELKAFTSNYHETMVREFFNQFTNISEAASDFILRTIWQGADISFLEMLEINSAEIAISDLDNLASNIELILSNLDPTYVLDSDTDSDAIDQATRDSGL